MEKLTLFFLDLQKHDGWAGARPGVCPGADFRAKQAGRAVGGNGLESSSAAQADPPA